MRGPRPLAGCWARCSRGEERARRSPNTPATSAPRRAAEPASNSNRPPLAPAARKIGDSHDIQHAGFVEGLTRRSLLERSGTLPPALVGGLLGAQGAAGERSLAEQPR